GITRVSKESVFSDLNNLKVVTTTSNEYATAFGFTQDEVFKAMDEIGMSQKEEVKKWYDGFVFGSVSDIYNPWSIINFLDTGKIITYWANTSGNSLVSKLIREGSRGIKEQFETLLQGNVIEAKLDEQIVYNQLEQSESTIWSLLIASGYLKVIEVEIAEEVYKLKLTNYEVVRMFQNMVSGWFGEKDGNYNDFVKALLLDDIDAMNEYMNRVALNIFSSFDTGKRPSGMEPERFYHGFVLGLIVDLRDKYIVTSNRESGFGRYDIMLEPLKEGNAIIIEFKVFNQRREKTLEDTLKAALSQIEEKNYAQILLSHGFELQCIKKYGFAFEGKNVLIG
ncbi:MAG: AAA family ATPase, partial [Lachnospiraceae bacterium]|nr:AAA family ATPase [Lachnospiraceae bacterium]